jgi:uncharacterized membrane protein
MDTEEDKKIENEVEVEVVKDEAPAEEVHHESEHKHEHHNHESSHNHNTHHNNEHKDHKSSEHNHTVMGVLSYLGPLVIIPYLMDKDNSFVKFHIKQGLVVFAINVILWVLTPMFFWHMWGISRLLNLATTILAIIGIVNVLQKKESVLPIVGSFSKYFKF